jgi:hypothetical protein
MRSPGRRVSGRRAARGGAGGAAATAWPAIERELRRLGEAQVPVDLTGQIMRRVRAEPSDPVADGVATSVRPAIEPHLEPHPRTIPDGTDYPT